MTNNNESPHTTWTQGMTPEYLDFHLKALLDISKKINIPIAYKYGGEILPGTSTYLAATSIDDLQTFKAVLKAPKAFINGALFEEFQPEYLKLLSLEAQEFKNFFFSNQVLGRIKLGTLNEVLPQFNQQDIVQIFTNDNLDIPEFDASFQTTVSILKGFENHQEIITHYLKHKCWYLSKEATLDHIKTALVKHFPDDLPSFSHIPVIAQYIRAQNQDNDLFIDQADEKIIHLRIDFNIIKDRFSIAQFWLADYKRIFRELVLQLPSSGKSWGIHHADWKDIAKINSPEQHTDLYVYAHSDAAVDKKHLKDMLVQFFSDCQHNNIDKTINMSEYAQRWLEHYLLNGKLLFKEPSGFKKSKI